MPDSAEELFAGHPEGLAVYRAVAEAVAALGPTEERVSTSQVAFRRAPAGRGFAYVWRPGQYVRSDVPAVLSIALPRAVASARFKQVVRPSASVWMHHLEVRDPAEIDVEVGGWLEEAREAAGKPPRGGRAPGATGAT